MRTITALGIALALANMTRAGVIEEPVSSDIITVTPSSTFGREQDVHHLLDGSGMSGDRHDDNGGAGTMWHTVENPASSGIPASPAWVRFDFAQPVRLSAVRIWNHNQSGLLNRGFRKTRLLTSADGARWATQNVELKRGAGLSERVAMAAKSPVKSVIIAGDSNYGGSCYGLSEVRFLTAREVAEKDMPFPTGMEIKPQRHYGHRTDGKPGRAVALLMTGANLYGDVTVEALGEKTLFRNLQGTGELTILLPPGVSVTNPCEATVTLRRGERTLTQTVTVPAQRQWTIYVYTHSHVDIGYTSYQSVVEETHKRSLTEAIKLGKQTENYPADARYRWNTEAAWQVERYLKSATPRQKEELLDGIRLGYVNVDAGYANVNTSVCADEELVQLLSPSQKIAAQSGRPADVLVQTDIPGMSWGMVPAMANSGLRYILALPNASDRIGRSRDLDHAPFWWVAPDGKSKVLFFQPYDYIQGVGKMQAVLRLHPEWDWNRKTSVDQIPPVFRTDNPRANFVDGYLAGMLPALEQSPAYPYDIFFVTWSLIDNSPPDADLSDAVKGWNEEYAFPHLIISSAHDMFAAFEKKFGDRLPVRRGDFTEYWTDGVGTGAKETAMNRAAAERIIQADTLWTMLHRDQPAPRAEFDEAWRYVLLGTEHTWGNANTSPENPFQQETWRVKQSYFNEANDRSKAVLASALASVSSPNSKTIAVFNTLNWPRTGLVTLPGGVTGIEGEISQTLSTGETVILAKDVPAFGARNYRAGDGAVAASAGCKAGDLTLENGLLTVSLDPKTGDIASVKDKAGNEYVKGAANTYRYLNGGDPPDKATGPSDVTISVKENGPLVASLLVASKADGCRELTREIRLTAGQPHLEITNVVDKLAVRGKEGIHFGFAFDVPDPRTRMDIPWGVVEVEKDQFPEGNRDWLTFQRWLDISGNDRGVTWCSLDAPMFEHGDITARILGPRGNWTPKLNPSATIFSWALNNHWHTNFPVIQHGRITFRYRVLPHSSGYDIVSANRFGMDQSRPLVVAPVKNEITLTPPVTVDNPRVVVSSVKSESGGIMVTLRSLSDQLETVKLRDKEITILPAGMVNVCL